MILRVLFLSGLALGAVLAADEAGVQTSLQGPVLGYVFDAGRQSIRPVNGIPGASHVGLPLALPFPVAAAAFSSRADFGLVVAAQDDYALYLVRNLGAAAPSLELMDRVLGGVDRIVLNSSDTAAALYSSEAQRVQMLRGLPANPLIGPVADLSPLGGKVTALALDRNAAQLLITVSEGGQNGLYLWSAAEADSQPRLLSTFQAPTAVALLNKDQDAVVADAGINQLVLIRRFATSADAFLLAGERDGLANPAGVEASADGRRIFIANAGGRSLYVWNIEAQAVEARLPLDAAPTRLLRFQGQSMFLLNEIGNDPLLLLENAGDAAVYFVPAGRGE
ncbi:MAG: hypothetical protein HY238_02430 [Acidobacteria bacterium]|nr:hypothetical protein [Acidobacteriota bacterium]